MSITILIFTIVVLCCLVVSVGILTALSFRFKKFIMKHFNNYVGSGAIVD